MLSDMIVTITQDYISNIAMPDALSTHLKPTDALVRKKSYC
jgi:hypothetical protein